MMTEEELLQSSEVPVLNSVVESGDETIIQTSRLSFEVMRELQMLGSQTEPHIHVGDTNEFPVEQIQDMVEQAVQHHMNNLRLDIRKIIEDAVAQAS